MNILSVEIDDNLLTTQEKSYLAKFSNYKTLSIDELFEELDKAWSWAWTCNDYLADSEKISNFYRHPVWVLNGIFSSADSESLLHREAIAKKINLLHCDWVVDFGGGLGELALQLAKLNTGICINIIEPYPTPLMLNRIRKYSNIGHLTTLPEGYDTIVAQDVLEHVRNPIEYIIFANCFYPLIKCHLPETFYLRYTFPFLMRFAGLKKMEAIDGAAHAILFKKVSEPNHSAIWVVNSLVRRIGPAINYIRSLI
jgi:hypothetical protein